MSDEKHPVVLRVRRARMINLVAIEKHVNRTSESLPTNVDPGRTRLNRVLYGSSEIVSDAITMRDKWPLARPSTPPWAEMILTANAKWFDRLAPRWRDGGDLGETGEAWLAANLKWLRKKYSGLINVTLHLDEVSPHLHVLLSPVATYEIGYRRGSHEVTKINYNLLFSDDIRKINRARREGTTSEATKLGRLQTEYSEAMSSFGLLRGRRNSKGRHITPSEHQDRINAELAPPPPPPFDKPEPRTIGPFGKGAVEKWREEKQVHENQRDAYFATLESKMRELEFMRDENERLKHELREKDGREKHLLADLKLAKAEIDKLRTIPLEEIAARLEPETGPIQLMNDDDTGRPRWKGAIDMLKDTVGFTYREAVAWLFYEFGAQAAMNECLQNVKPTFRKGIQRLKKTPPPHPKKNLREELEQFKGEINLAEYASTVGYEIDRKESSKNSLVMRRESDADKIVITTARNGTGMYFSVRDNTDNGTIIDFVQKRHCGTLGQVRQELRTWLDPATRPQVQCDYCQPIPTTKDEQSVLRFWQRSKPIKKGDCGYLESRGITYDDLCKLGINDLTKVDARGNILFGHYGEYGLIGFEMKNKNFTGFPKGGSKGLWGAGGQNNVQRIVVCESAIDALSYSKLHPDGEAVYLSFGGSWNPQQPNLLKRWFDEHFPGTEIVAAVDNDAAGDAYVVALDELAPGRVKRHSPEVRGQDWSDVLMEREGLRTPVPQATPVKKTHAVAGPGR